ncbi:MAG: hypothetical protein HYY61_06825 [Deltaproteobacteria bacterium]|nr:hypothetical protein [Deltaproteobacteria bacterium]
MKTCLHRFGAGSRSVSIGLFVFLLLPFQTFAQNRADAVRSVNAILNFAARSDSEDRNITLEGERFTLTDRSSPVTHAVLSAIAQTAGSADTLNGGRAAAVHEDTSEVIKPSEIAAAVFSQGKSELRAEKITKEIAKAIEEKLSTHSDFKLAEREDRKELREKEREEKFGDGQDRNHSERADLISQVTNFNDGKEGRSKELERLAFNKTENGRSESKGGRDDKADKKDDTPSVAKGNAGGKAGKSDTKESDDKKSDDRKSDDKKSDDRKDKDGGKDKDRD